MASEEEEKRSFGDCEKHCEKHDSGSYCRLQVQDGPCLFPFPHCCQHHIKRSRNFIFIQAVEIKNFLGFKMNKVIEAPKGVTISKKEE